MAEYTEKLNLYKPNQEDEVEVGTSLAENFQKIEDFITSAIQAGNTGSLTVLASETITTAVTFPKPFAIRPKFTFSPHASSIAFAENLRYIVKETTETGATIEIKNISGSVAQYVILQWIAIGM